MNLCIFIYVQWGYNIEFEGNIESKGMNNYKISYRFLHACNPEMSEKLLEKDYMYEELHQCISDINRGK